jgi:hypothetical protein
VRRIGSFTAISLFLLCLGCGTEVSPRLLQSITLGVSPAENGVQFVATGHYNQDPMAFSPLSALWTIPLLGGAAGPTITQNGLATCTTGAPGTFDIAVYAPADPGIPISQLYKAKKVVVAFTTITCP